MKITLKLFASLFISTLLLSGSSCNQEDKVLELTSLTFTLQDELNNLNDRYDQYDVVKVQNLSFSGEGIRYIDQTLFEDLNFEFVITESFSISNTSITELDAQVMIDANPFHDFSLINNNSLEIISNSNNISGEFGIDNITVSDNESLLTINTEDVGSGMLSDKVMIYNNPSMINCTLDDDLYDCIVEVKANESLIRIESEALVLKWIIIEDNPSLTNIKFDKLSTLTGASETSANFENNQSMLKITNNNSLTDLYSFNALTKIKNIHFYIKDNAGLSTISGFNSVKSVSFNIHRRVDEMAFAGKAKFEITGNPQLMEVSGFQSLTKIDDYSVDLNNNSSTNYGVLTQYQ